MSVNRFFIALYFILTFTPSFAAEKVIRLNLSPLGFPPYLLTNPPSGIMYDVLVLIAQQQGYEVVTQELPEIRAYRALEKNTLDAHASALEWVDKPERFIFTDPIMQVRDLVFTRNSDPFKYNKIEDLFGHSVGVHLGYTYQSLSPHFKSNKIKRVDNSNELYMLKMLKKERLNIAIITEHVGLWLIKKHHMQGQFSLSEKAIDTTDYRLVFSKKWLGFVTVFNKELERLKQNGKLLGILSRYR